MRITSSILAMALAAAAIGSPMAGAQAATPGAASATTAPPRQSGTVKAVTPQDLVLTNAAGQDFAVNMPASARVLLVDPQTRDLKTARPGSIADIAGGDKAIVSGTAGDTGQTLTATRVLLLKSGAIAAMHAGEQAAWAHSQGGVVRSVDAGTGTLVIASGPRVTTITTTPATLVRRYTGGSVRFEDAVKSTVSAIQPGDQVQARGARGADPTTLAADEIVTGTFINYSGLLTAVDAAAGTVSLKDLASKKAVMVSVTAQTNVRKLTPEFLGGGVGTSHGDAGAERAPGTPGPGGTDRAATAAGPGAGPSAQSGGRTAGAGEPGQGRRRVDLARIVNRLPTETLGDLKPGQAVMIVASGNDNGQPTAVTLLSGVESLLTSTGAGQTTLSPWSLGGAEGQGAGETGGGGGGGR